MLKTHFTRLQPILSHINNKLLGEYQKLKPMEHILWKCFIIQLVENRQWSIVPSKVLSLPDLASLILKFCLFNTIRASLRAIRKSPTMRACRQILEGIILDGLQNIFLKIWSAIKPAVWAIARGTLETSNTSILKAWR